MKVRFLARSLQGNDEFLIQGGREQLHTLALPFQERLENPDVLVFLSGGTESLAIPHLRPGILLCPIGTANGLAAALEVKAYAQSQGMPTTVVHNLESSELTRTLWRAISRLASIRVAAVGAPSEWLIKSGDTKLLQEIGVSVIDLDPNDIDLNQEPDAELRQKLSTIGRTSRVSTESLEKALALHAGLVSLLTTHRLDAFALRCFDFVAEKQVSACLSMAVLNSQGIVAACEGDMETLASMLLVKIILGKPCFMANLTRMRDGIATFAHCTADLSLLSSFELDTHFESNASVAVRAQIHAADFTVFRAAAGKTFTVFEGEQKETSYVEEMCRTQLSMKLPESFVNSALGNHQVIIPGRWSEALSRLSLFGWTQIH